MVFVCYKLGNVLHKTWNSYGWMHGAPYRGYGYVPLRFGGNVVRRMGTQQQHETWNWQAFTEVEKNKLFA